MPASYSVYTVIAGVNLNNLKANHNTETILSSRLNTVIAGVNLNNLKANHNNQLKINHGGHTVIAGVNLNNLKANHNRREQFVEFQEDCYRWRKFK